MYAVARTGWEELKGEGGAGQVVRGIARGVVRRAYAHPAPDDQGRVRAEGQ